VNPRRRPPAVLRAAGLLLAAAVATEPAIVSAAAEGETLPPDLRTRTDGIDWPGFLGPNRDSKSPETGIRADWAADPPPLLWHLELGEGYAAPSVARGRLFYFTRVRDQALLVVTAARDAALGRAVLPQHPASAAFRDPEPAADMIDAHPPARGA